MKHREKTTSQARTAVEALRTEAGLRRQIAERAPQQLVHEAAARDAALRLARPRAESASWPSLAPQAPAHGPGGRSR
ncbi:hypothetical protein CG740_38240 [Streptomyces sp. CB01201]|uniref:hypothetical protein n=1 Tax=unclassified Streptomyces TaxID=2593676 RepID=UPI000C27F5D7|nr:hypothetical protein [Streptomyces sp. CB01201]PJM98011.1 hypothetical protein CG740_38240 [Streptomyces sp. CB01201]